MDEQKKNMLSLIQPTNTPHLGNYLGAMQNWGKEAGGQLAGNGAGDASAPAAAAAQGAGVVGRTARSVVCAAVINAGIEVVMHGAGAVSSILGDGQKELFGDIDLGDAE